MLFTTQAHLVTAEHDTAIAEFNVAPAIGRPTAPELRLPMRLYDMDRHYQRGKGQVDRFCRRPQRVIPLSDRSKAVLEVMARGQRRVVHDSLLERDGFEPSVPRQIFSAARTCAIEPRALRQAEQWINARRIEWEHRLDGLGEYLKTLQTKGDCDGSGD